MKISKVSKVLIALLMSTSVLVAGPAEKKGLEIAKKMDRSNTGFIGESSRMKMILINAYGDKIVREIVNKIKETRTDGDKSVVEFLSPKDVRKTKLLTWAHKRKNDSQWLYLPKSKKIKRISSRSKSGAFMGSEFSYEDMGSQEVEKYTYKFIKDAKYKGRDVWVNTRYPVDKNSGYSKQITYVDKKWLQPLKIEYYDRRGSLLKVATFRRYKKISGFWRAGKLTMSNRQTKKKSILQWSNRQLKKRFSDREFTSGRLKN